MRGYLIYLATMAGIAWGLSWALNLIDREIRIRRTWPNVRRRLEDAHERESHMAVRAKFAVTGIERPNHRTDVPAVVTLEPRYDESIAEDQRYSKFTPAGKLEMTIDNPPALAQFEIGRQYYIDITPAE
jgi:hypothetical protein